MKIFILAFLAGVAAYFVVRLARPKTRRQALKLVWKHVPWLVLIAVALLAVFAFVVHTNPIKIL